MKEAGVMCSDIPPASEICLYIVIFKIKFKKLGAVCLRIRLAHGSHPELRMRVLFRETAFTTWSNGWVFRSRLWQRCLPPKKQRAIKLYLNMTHAHYRDGFLRQEDFWTSTTSILIITITAPSSIWRDATKFQKGSVFFCKQRLKLEAFIPESLATNKDVDLKKHVQRSMASATAKCPLRVADEHL